jgi:probable rRNA maturation factor
LCCIFKEKRIENALVILEKQVAGLSGEALGRFVLRARKAVGLRGQVGVLVTSSAALRALNRRFRSENQATDVLSFPAVTSISNSRNAKLAGEIAISAEIALKNSLRLGHPAAQEVKVLALHGILHLAGFDHERDNGEMARKEVKLRRALGLPAALIERVKIERVKIEPLNRQSSKGRRGAVRASARRMA